MSEDTIIATSVCGITADFTARRIKRINESLAFSGGTFDNREKHIVAVLPDGREAYFLKPGKEAKRKQNPNPNDMYPCVDNAVGGRYDFEDIWEYLVKISIINRVLFRKVLVLLYRLCYFLDHRENEAGRLRYEPSREMLDYIDKMDFSISDGFKDKFKMDCAKLMEYLHMIDMIGWNEDVKYHGRDGELDSSRRLKRIGMPNTVLSVISVPLMINDFVENIIENTDRVDKINVRLILSAMQKFSRSRGVCALPDTQLLKYLSPYLLEKPV